MPPNAQRGGQAGIPRAPRGVQPVLWHLIYAYSHQLRLDPYAVAAVSIAEGGGRFGAVGDNGSSFGPFQLHVGGALPAGMGAGFANSPRGVLYAMTHMAQSGAAGLRGLSAIRAIVTRFERPAAPGPEVSRSFATYGGWNGSGGSLPAGYQGSPGGGGGVNFRALAREQSQSLARMLAGQQAAFKSQLAAENQSRLVASLEQQASARIGGARAAQQNLSGSGLGIASPDTTQVLGAEGKTRLDLLRAAALRRAGIS